MARVLIVEDELLIAMMLQDWLTELGHEPIGPAVAVSSAIALIDSGKPDAVILDVNLRGERCEAIADVLMHQAVPFALATGEDAGSVGSRFSGRPTLAKPYDFEAVRRVVELLCEPCGAPSLPDLVLNKPDLLPNQPSNDRE